MQHYADRNFSATTLYRTAQLATVHIIHLVHVLGLDPTSTSTEIAARKKDVEK